MSLSTWWHGDGLSPLAALPGFTARETQDVDLLMSLTRLDAAEIGRRLRSGHRPMVGAVGVEPVAYGWIATVAADIGELGLQFHLPRGNRYLWDFATLPGWHGRGIYPRLLQAIIRREDRPGVRLWIIHAPENGPSRSGIRKAGFAAVGKLAPARDGRAALAPLGSPERVAAATALFRVPVSQDGISPCWHCGGADYPAAPGAADCSCEPAPLTAASACDCLPAEVPAPLVNPFLNLS